MGNNANLESADSTPAIRTGAEYIDSLRGRNLRVFLLGEKVAEPVDHPLDRRIALAGRSGQQFPPALFG